MVEDEIGSHRPRIFDIFTSFPAYFQLFKVKHVYTFNRNVLFYHLIWSQTPGGSLKTYCPCLTVRMSLLRG